MKETEHSLSLWFGAVGMLALVDILLRLEKVYVAASDPFAILRTPAALITVLISLVTVVAYLFLAIKLRDLIVTHPNIIRTVLAVSMVYLAITVALLGMITHSSRGLFWPALELAIERE